MLHARVDLITADPLVLGGCLKYIESEVRPAVESQPGSLGLSLLASPELRAAVLESFWASHHALQASEQITAPLRGELARRARGSLTVERYRILVFEREAELRSGEGVRLTRIEVKPSGVEEVIEAFGDSAVPLLAETPGFRSALLFADPASGHLISETVWRDPRARAASPSVAAVIRADVLDTANCLIRAVEDYSLVFSSARKA
ncbi:MAG TPA: antibiotic biosynthesis monooxygenase [Streptosporangiaceae bacterium]|nr:antibiotic biosynthesis monooxygenase [Streptosporangiaceae bacterium]